MENKTGDKTGDKTAKDEKGGNTKCIICYKLYDEEEPGKKFSVCPRCEKAVEILKTERQGCRLQLKACKGKYAIAVAFDPFKQWDTLWCEDCLFQTSKKKEIEVLKQYFTERKCY